MRGLERRKEILLLLISLLLFFLSFELLLRSTGKAIRYDVGEMSPWRTYEPYTWDLYSPLLGWVSKPNFHTRVAGFTVVTNARGLRETRDYSYERVPGKVRLLAVGDSFTFGYEVEPHEVFTEVLERRIEDSEVINMGVHGYGTDQMVLILKEEGVRYLPDLVLVGFYVGGMQRNVARFRVHNKPRFQLKDGRLVLTNVPVPFAPQVDRGEEGVASLGRGSMWGCRTCAWLSRRAQLLRDALAYMGLGEQWRLAEAIFLEMDRVSKEVGARVLIILFANKFWAKGEFNPLLMWSFSRVMDRFSRKTGIPVLNLLGDFRGHYRDPKAVELFSNHWNSEGHRFVSDKIYAYLLKHPELLSRRRALPP